MKKESRLQALYRFYDKDDALLYVGVSKNPGQRLRGHSSSSSFWAQVVTIKLEWHDTREGVLKAEKEAIKSEGPKYNRMYGTYSRATDERYRGWTGGPPNVYEVASAKAKGLPYELGPTMRYVTVADGIEAIEWDDGAGYLYATVEVEPRMASLPYEKSDNRT